MAFDLTISQYARHRGCDEKAVRKAIAEGRITALEVDGKKRIDAAVADIQWAKNTRARADSGARTSAQGPGAGRGRGAGRGPADDDSDDGEDYYRDRARRERVELARAELALAKDKKSVLDREQALQAVFTRFRELRDAGLVLGRRIAPVLAPLTDEREIRVQIDRAVAELFDTFARRTLQTLVDTLSERTTVLPEDIRQPMQTGGEGQGE